VKREPLSNLRKCQHGKLSRFNKHPRPPENDRKFRLPSTASAGNFGARRLFNTLAWKINAPHLDRISGIPVEPALRADEIVFAFHPRRLTTRATRLSEKFNPRSYKECGLRNLGAFRRTHCRSHNFPNRSRPLEPSAMVAVFETASQFRA
jgi:hypothetical protein